MTRLSNDDFDEDVTDEARARADAEWFGGDSPPNAARLGAAITITSAAIVIAAAVLILL